MSAVLEIFVGWSSLRNRQISPAPKICPFENATTQVHVSVTWLAAKASGALALVPVVMTVGVAEVTVMIVGTVMTVGMVAAIVMIDEVPEDVVVASS